MQKTTIKAQPRVIIGRQAKSLRRQGLVPAVIYGRGFNPLPIQIPVKEFERVYAEVGESSVVYLSINNEDHPTIIHDVVRDAVNDSYVHADFYKVRLDEKIHAKIQLNFIGESPAVKSFGGILVKNISEIEVEGLPQDLPHQIDVDISKLAELKSALMVKDLSVSNKLELKANPESIVVLVQEPISEEELKAQLDTTVTATAEDVEVIKKEKREEEPAEEGSEPQAPSPESK